MKYLLDTNIFLWFFLEDPRLNDHLYDIIIDEKNEVFLSVTSIWEIVIKYNLGKLILPDKPENCLLNYLSEYNFQILELKSEDIFYLSCLPQHHRDPFDRILISQSKVENIKLLYSDEVFNKYF
jgi:PIN domain nuclease of toxin-antitoxin system